MNFTTLHKIDSMLFNNLCFWVIKSKKSRRLS